MIAPDVLKRATAAGVVSAAVIGGTALLSPDSLGAGGTTTFDAPETSESEREVHPGVDGQAVLRRAPSPSGSDDERQRVEGRVEIHAGARPDVRRARRTIAQRNGDARRALQHLRDVYRRDGRGESGRVEPQLDTESRRIHQAVQRALQKSKHRAGETSELEHSRRRIMQALERAIQRSQAGDYPTTIEENEVILKRDDVLVDEPSR